LADALDVRLRIGKDNWVRFPRAQMQVRILPIPQLINKMETNKEKFLKLVSEHDHKTMEDVKRRVKYRRVLNIINRFKIKLNNK
jgi:hypothetical protein